MKRKISDDDVLVALKIKAPLLQRDIFCLLDGIGLWWGELN